LIKTTAIALYVFLMGLELSTMKCFYYLFVLFTTTSERTHSPISGKQLCVPTVNL